MQLFSLSSRYPLVCALFIVDRLSKKAIKANNNLGRFCKLCYNRKRMPVRIANKKIIRFFFRLAPIALIFVALFGLSHGMAGMEKRSDGTMSGCMFSGQAEMCTMTFSEHIAHWQAMFTTTAPQKTLAFALLLLLVVVFIAVAILKRNLLLLSNYYATRWRLYIRQNPNLSLFSPLKEAFSSGILHPKIY